MKTVGVILLLIGGAILAIGLMFGFTRVISDGYDCGTALGRPIDPETTMSVFELERTDCAEARASRERVAYAGVILGVAVGLSGFVVAARRG